MVDGTFMEEPGSGAVATIENKKVSVGTVEWVQRYVSHCFPHFWRHGSLTWDFLAVLWFFRWRKYCFG